jgi:hypothetical protein
MKVCFKKETAVRMRVSRGTVWRCLDSDRKKVQERSAEGDHYHMFLRFRNTMGMSCRRRMGRDLSASIVCFLPAPYFQTPMVPDPNEM